MSRAHVAVIVVFLASASTLRSQRPGAGGATEKDRRIGSQFDFLIGEWDVVATPKVSSLAALVHGVPKLRGTWKAHRTADGSIEDELRITDESGNPRSLLRTVRRFDARLNQWTLTETDALRNKTTEWESISGTNEIISTTRALDGEGTAYVARVRIIMRSAEEFQSSQERSYDGGKIWSEPRLTIEARRRASRSDK